MSITVRIVFQKRMPDGVLRQSKPLYDSSSGEARIKDAIEYARRLREGCESGTLASKWLCEMEPNRVMTAYVVHAHTQKTPIDPSTKEEAPDPALTLDTMVLGSDDEWLGDIRMELSCYIDLGADLSSDALTEEEEPW